jgi:hypothetical protein
MKHMKLAAIIVGLLCAGLLGGVASYAASAAKPPAPPGQDPCSHGNTGKPCRPDPQSDNGKDCEKHGKQGGVNEDHCKGETQPPPPPPPGCTANCGSTTPTPPNPGCVDNCGNTTTSEQTTTTPAAVTPPPKSKPPTKQQLKKQLKKQEQALTSAERAHVGPAPRKGELSNTGIPLAPVSFLGLGLLGLGLALRRVGA